MKHLTDANKDKLLAFLRSRAAAGEASLKSWGRDQRPQIPGILAEEIADALVSEGKATRETKVHGGRVWRAAVEPIEKKHLDLSLEEPTPEPDVEEEPEEEPVAVAGAAEPCQGCADLRRTRDFIEGKAFGFESQLLEAKAERDRLASELLQARATSVDIMAEVAETLRMDGKAEWPLVINRVRLLADRDRRPTHYQAPANDPGAIAHYLLGLPADRWQALATARQQLAEGRTLAERGARLQTEALAAVEGLLSAPAGEAPVVEEPEPPPSGEQPASESDEPDPTSAIGRVLRWLRKRPDARARQAAEALSLSVPHASAALGVLTRRGLVERVELGLYRAVRAKEAA